MKFQIIICRDHNSLHKMDKLIRVSKENILVATDNTVVKDYLNKKHPHILVESIETKDSFWSVSKDVIKIIDAINEWFRSFNPISVYNYLLDWNLNVEGGLMSQRVQDILILIKSYDRLINKVDVKNVIILKSIKYTFEDNVLITYLESNGINFNIYLNHYLKNLIGTLFLYIKSILKIFYGLIYELRVGRLSKLKKTKENYKKNSILFQGCSSLDKHIDDIKFLMKDLKDKGQDVVAVTWSADGKMKKKLLSTELIKAGLKVIELEKNISLKIIIQSFYVAIVAILESLKTRSLINKVEFNRVPLRKLLCQSINISLMTDVPQRYRYIMASNKALGYIKPSAIKIWGGAEFFEGRFWLEFFEVKKNKVQWIHYWPGSSLDYWPYVNKKYKPNLFLSKSINEVLQIRQRYGDGVHIEIVGQPRFNDLFLQNDKQDNIHHRNINLIESGKIVLGLDPGGVLRGYLNHIEQIELFESLIKYISTNENFYLIIKPHPSYSISHLMSIFKKYSPKNCLILDGKSSVIDFIRSCDIIISKYSTLQLEGALLNKCVISVILDNEKRFNIYDNLTTVFYSTSKLFKELDLISKNSKTYDKWKKSKLKKQQDILYKFYQGNGKKSASSVIIDFLNNK